MLRLEERLVASPLEEVEKENKVKNSNFLGLEFLYSTPRDLSMKYPTTNTTATINRGFSLNIYLICESLLIKIPIVNF